MCRVVFSSLAVLVLQTCFAVRGAFASSQVDCMIVVCLVIRTVTAEVRQIYSVT